MRDASRPLPPIHELGQFIPVHYHGQMLSDSHRMDGFVRAIKQVVRPGMRVVDLGGGTGILSWLAAKQGAQVTYVEQNPALAALAAKLFHLNPYEDRIRLVEGDASGFVTSEPVDVVLCEMLHVGLLREQQIQVCGGFAHRHQTQHGRLPEYWIPTATHQGVQLVQQDYEYAGFHAPVPVFQDPYILNAATRELTPAILFQLVDYTQPLPKSCACDLTLPVNQGWGWRLNAVRLITKNVLAIDLQSGTLTDWHNQYLVMPVESPLDVQESNQVQIQFDYAPGDPIEAFRPRVRLVG